MKETRKTKDNLTEYIKLVSLLEKETKTYSASVNKNDGSIKSTVKERIHDHAKELDTLNEINIEDTLWCLTWLYVENNRNSENIDAIIMSNRGNIDDSIATIHSFVKSMLEPSLKALRV